MHDYEYQQSRHFKSEVPQRIHPCYHVKLPDPLIGTRWINHLPTGTRLITITGYGYGTLAVMWQFSDGSERHRTTIAKEVLEGTLVLVESN